MDNFIINKEDAFENLLSKEHYFQSLLQVLHYENILHAGDIESIQFQLIDILTETVSYYTKNKSSSVKVEIAEQIMLSIYYTIGMFIKSHRTMKEKIALIKEKDIKYLFTEGEKILKAKVDGCKALLDIVQETSLQTENYAYIDTVYYGIPLFFKEYDLRFASHEAAGSIDYPLAVDEIELTGIEYIENYLNKLILENKFCSYFDSTEINALLKGFNKDAYHMLINIFQLILTNCLGSILIDKRGRSLEITEEDRLYLKSVLKNLSKEELNELIFVASDKLCSRLSIEDKKLIEYINKAILNIIPEIKRNIETDTLENVFITLCREKKNMLKYEDGESLNNGSFRKIIEEISRSSSVKEKIRIIKEEFHSLKDLTDALSADCIFGDEFIDIFKAMGDFELALLIRNISNDGIIDTDYGTESEKEWHKKLKVYLDSLDDLKKEEIVGIARGIEL